MSLPAPLAVTLRVARAFERLGMRYLIGGSLASSFHGVPRSTNDADLLAELPGQCVDAFVADLAGEFYVDGDMIRDAISRGACFNVIHLETMFKVDVFILRRDDLMQEEMQRREQHVIGEGTQEQAFFASAEDTILQKLDWYRKGHGVSDRQWRDVLGVIKVQAERLDIDYLRRWAPHLGVEELLERALSDGLASMGRPVSE